MAQVHVQLSDDKKQKWEQAISESVEYNSISDLVRLSVARELSGEHDSRQATEIESDGRMGEVLEGINQIQSRVGDLEGRISSIEGELSTSSEVGKLATKVFDLLPHMEPGTDAWEQEKIQLREEAEHSNSDEVRTRFHGWKGTVEGLSKALDEPEFVVSEALEKLRADAPQLLRETDDGRFYKVE